MKIEFPLIRTLIIFVVTGLFVACGGAPDTTQSGTSSASSSSSSGDDSSPIKIGSGGGAQFNDGVASFELKDSGVSSASWDISVVVVDGDNIAVTEPYTVNFTSSCVAAGLASLDETSVSTIAGRASVTYSSGSCNGIDTVVASLASGASANADLNIDENVSDGGEIDEIDETVRIGNGSGASFEEGVLVAGSSSLQAGGRTNVSASLVDSQGVLISQSATVTFTSVCAADGLAAFGQNSVASTAGQVVTSYTATGCVGEDVVSASASINGEDISANITLDVTADTVSGLEFVSVSQPVLSLPGTGGVETTEVVFRLIGELGASVLGENVSFQLTSSVGGVAIPESRVSDISDSEGLVSTLVQSGTVSTTLSVIATHDATGNQTTSDGIVVSSGVPVDSKFSVSLSQLAPQNAFDTNGVEVDVGIIASDFFGNDVPDGSQVFFASPESGNIDSSCVLQSGECSVKWRSAGQRPRDLRASIIAYTSGAEDFTDNNGNTVFDAEDTPGNDLGEPFIDEDEDGEYEVGEFFVDANSNGVRDEANGLWDGPCLSAVNNAADCSGDDSVLLSQVIIVRMPTRTPRLISSGISFDGGENFSELNAGDTIYTGSLSRVVVVALVGDSNTEADVFGGHPLPEGATVSFTLNASSGSFDLDTDTATVLERTVSPTSVTGVLTDQSDSDSAPGEAADNAIMSLRVTLPNGQGTYTLGTYTVVFGPEP